MNTPRTPSVHLRSTAWVAAALASALLLSTGCAGMSRQERSTAIGAGVGALGGAILTGGAVGTLGGAAVGGVIGHELNKDK